MRSGDDARPRPRGGDRTDSLPRRAIRPLSLGHGALPGLPLVPVGQPAARSRVPRDLPRAVALVVPPPPRPASVARRALADPMAPDPPLGLLRAGQALERRPRVARSERSPLSLRDPALADMDRVVHASPAGGDPERDDGRRAPARRRGSLPRVRAAAHPVHGGRRDRVLTGNDPPHGQLRILQLAHARALRAAPGRRRMAEAMASLGGATGASSRALAVVDGHARRGGSLRAELGSDAP